MVSQIVTTSPDSRAPQPGLGRWPPVTHGRQPLQARERHDPVAVPRVPWLGAMSALCSSAGWSFLIRRIGGGGTIGMAGALLHASLKHGDPHGLLLGDGTQMDDPWAHDERGLFPTGGIQRKPGWE
jgi:hypothetical protein